MSKPIGQITTVQLRGKINAIPGGIGGAAEPKLQSKLVEITENGVKDVIPDGGYDGLERVTIFTEIPGEVVEAYAGAVTISNGQ